MKVETSVSLSTAAVAATALIGAWALLDAYKKRRRLPYSPGPPEKSWIGGNALDMPRSHLWIRFTEWAKQYGDVVHVRVHTNHIIILSSYDAVVDLFDKRGYIYSHRSVRTMAIMMGWAHFISFEAYGDRWKASRRHANSSFNKKAIVKYQDGQTQDVHVFLQRLLSDPENFILHTKWLAGSIIMRTTYGYKVLENNDPYITISDDAIASLERTGVAGSYLVDSYPFLRYLPTWLPGMKFKKQAEEWSNYPARMAQEPFDWTKEQIKNGLAAPSFLSGLLEQNKDGSYGEEVIKWTSASMYSAGVHTTVGTISNFILAMVLYPEVFRRAREEVDRVVGTERLPLVSDRVDLPYIECVLLETLRWYPVAPLAIPHRVMQDDEYRGYHIPSKSTVISNVYAITRDERVYPDPEKFIPERFDGSHPGPSPPNPRDFIFGVGRRVCPGNHIADVTVFLAIANLIATMDIGRACDANGIQIEPVAERSSGFISWLHIHVYQFEYPELSENSGASKEQDLGNGQVDVQSLEVLQKQDPIRVRLDTPGPLRIVMPADYTTLVKVFAIATAAIAGARAIEVLHKRQRQLPLPPGPPGKSWLAGNAEDIPALFTWMKFTEWAKEYGDIVHVRVHGSHLIVLSSYDAMVDLFETRGQIYSDRPVRPMPFLMGWRDIVSFRDNDARFKVFRRHINIGFSKKAATNYQAGQTKGVHVFLQRLLSNSDNIVLELNRLAASFIMKVTYGYSIIGDNDPYIRVADEAFQSLVPGLAENILVNSYPFLQYLPSWLPGMGFKKAALEARKFPTKMAIEPFEWTKAQMKEGNAAPSLVRCLLEENQNGQVDEEAIMWTAATMYGAGVHSTVATMSNFIAAMMLYPEVARKAREEIDRVIGIERLPTMSDRADLPYLECVLSETLRWHPAAMMEVPHRVRQEDEYRGYRIPANSTIRYNMYAITRDERMFPDPEKFIPERFDKSNPGPRPLEPRDFMFGVGRRVCPGKFVVDASLFLLMANIIATMDINKPRDGEGNEFEPKVERTGYPINQVLPFECSITPRSEHAARLINSVVMFGEE